MKKSSNINDYVVKQTEKHRALFNVACVCTLIAYAVFVCTFIAYAVFTVCTCLVGMINVDAYIINTLGIIILLIIFYILGKQLNKL